MLVVDCPGVASGRQLVSERRIVRMTDDGAGTITVVVACWCGHLQELVTGRATTDRMTSGRAATPLRRRTPAPVPAAVGC
jgi:hypothetical protein